MNTLLINLTRFGDLLQTQPVISGLKDQGQKVGLVCLENFAGAAGLLRGVDQVFPLPGARLLAALDKDWREAVRQTEAWFEQGTDFEPDRVVNLTPSLCARLMAAGLGKRAQGVRSTGFLVDELGFNADDTGWARFLLVASGQRGVSPFNLVDLFRKSAGLDDRAIDYELKTPPSQALEWVGQTLENEAPQDARGFVCFQLGASEEKRRWPVEFYARLGSMLFKEVGLCPVLLGTKTEMALGERFTALCPESVNLQGRTDLEQLAASLVKCGFLITGDTGTMHLAAGLGVPVLSIFLATAQPWDTGPYREGNVCLEPDMDCHPCAFGAVCPHDHECRRAVLPETVFGLARSFLKTGSWPRAEELGARVWLGLREKDGFMTLRSLSGHENEDRTRWIALQRHFYRRFLDDARSREWPGPVPALTGARCAELVPHLEMAARILLLVEQMGTLLMTNPTDKLKSKFLVYWQKVMDSFSAHPYLSALGLLFRFDSQQAGDDLTRFLRLSARYRALCHDFLSCLK